MLFVVAGGNVTDCWLFDTALFQEFVAGKDELGVVEANEGIVFVAGADKFTVGNYVLGVSFFHLRRFG